MYFSTHLLWLISPVWHWFIWEVSEFWMGAMFISCILHCICLEDNKTSWDFPASNSDFLSLQSVPVFSCYYTNRFQHLPSNLPINASSPLPLFQSVPGLPQLSSNRCQLSPVLHHLKKRVCWWGVNESNSSQLEFAVTKQRYSAEAHSMLTFIKFGICSKVHLYNTANKNDLIFQFHNGHDNTTAD